jgi:Fe2+ transport system protein B
MIGIGASVGRTSPTPVPDAHPVHGRAWRSHRTLGGGLHPRLAWGLIALYSLAIAGVAIVFAFLRKELALQLLVALAVVQYGAGAATLGGFMSPAQLFVFAIVVSVSVPCIATLATLRGELGTRAAAVISGGSLVLAIGLGAVLARLLGIV